MIGQPAQGSKRSNCYTIFAALGYSACLRNVCSTLWLKGEGHAKINYYFCINTLFGICH